MIKNQNKLGKQFCCGTLWLLVKSSLWPLTLATWSRFLSGLLLKVAGSFLQGSLPPSLPSFFPLFLPSTSPHAPTPIFLWNTCVCSSDGQNAITRKSIWHFLILSTRIFKSQNSMHPKYSMSSWNSRRTLIEKLVNSK